MPVDTSRTPPERSGEEPGIRPCRADDLRPLEWDGAHAGEREIIEETFERQRAGETLMLVAAGPDDFPIAQIWMDFPQDGDEDVYFWAVRTHPHWRGCGIGTRLVRHAEREAARRGFTRAELTVEPDNAGALRFYARLGYARCGETLATYRCRSPDGELLEWTSCQLKLCRALRPGANGPSASAGRWATSPTVASRR